MVGVATSFVLGSIIGAIATIAGSYFLFWRRQRVALGRLRRALETELSALSYVDELAEAGEYETLAATVVKPIVYETNAGEIGHLTDEEIEALVRFYTGLDWLRDQQDIEDKKERVHEIVDERHRALAAISAAR